MRIAVVTSRATSLLNVAKDIAYVAKMLGYTPLVLDYMVNPYDLKHMANAAIVVMAMNPLTSRPWLLLSRDATKLGMPSFVYTTIEGRIPRHLVKEWMRRDIVFVANSRYTEMMLRDAGLNVVDTVYHGVNFEEVGRARSIIRTARRIIEDKVGKGIIVGTVAHNHPRKGLGLYAEAVRIIRSHNKNVKFYIVSSSTATQHFNGIDGVYVDTNFGKRAKAEILAMIGAFDIYVQPSLAEGFGLPVLEAMAMQTLPVHPAYEPLLEFSGDDVAVLVPVSRIEYDSFNEGIEYELHVYEPKDMAEAVLDAVDIVAKQRDRLEDMRRRMYERAKKFDVTKLYPRLVELLSQIETENM